MKMKMNNFEEREENLKVLRKLRWNTTVLSMMRDEEVRKATTNLEKPNQGEKRNNYATI